MYDVPSPKETLAIIVISACSFKLNGAGFSAIPNIFVFGMTRSHSRPSGHAIIDETKVEITNVGV